MDDGKWTVNVSNPIVCLVIFSIFAYGLIDICIKVYHWF